MKYLLLLLCILTFLRLSAKENEIDLLLKKIKTEKNDTTKINHLNEIAFYYIKTNPTLSRKYANEAQVLSIKFKFKRGEGISLLYLGQLETENSKLKYSNFKKALTIFKELDDKPNQAMAIFRIANIQFSKGEYNNTKIGLNNVLQVLKHEKDKETELFAKTYNLLGVCDFNLGNDAGALYYFLKTRKIHEKLKNYNDLCNINYNLGSVYQVLKNMQKAEYYFSELLRIATKTDDKAAISLSYYSIGNILLEKEKYDQALENSLKALNITSHQKKEEQDIIYIEAIYYDLAKIYFNLKNFKEAKKYYSIIYNSSLIRNEPRSIGISLIGLGDLDFENKDFSKAEKKYEQSLKIFQEIQIKIEISTCYEKLSDLAMKMGNYKKSLEYYKQHTIYKDSVNNEDNKLRFEQVRMQNEFDEKTKAESIKNKHFQEIKDAQIDVINANLKKEKTQFLFVVFALVSIAVILLIVINRYRLSKKQKETIEHQNSQILESINYSKKIQDALLPNVNDLKKSLKNVFVFYEPKDIVSGDFYWFKNFKDISIIACVDCTGHGVPGAFMSALGSLIMTNIITESSNSPSQIISELNNEIIQLLHQQNRDEIQDGMDLSLCIINHNQNKISFSGARNGIIIVRNGTAQRYKANLLPVGGNYIKKGIPIERNFTTQTIDIKESDWIYMYTDGFIEQIGGEEKTPMNYYQYEQILNKVSNNSIHSVKSNILNGELNKWKGFSDRTDDILIIGFQII